MERHVTMDKVQTSSLFIFFIKYNLFIDTRMAQWIAHPTSNREVAGSSPAVGVFSMQFMYTNQALLAQLVRAHDC